MNNFPLFIRVQNQLVNISSCRIAYVQGQTLTFECHDGAVEFEYETEGDAKRNFEVLQQIITSKNLLLGAVN